MKSNKKQLIVWCLFCRSGGARGPGVFFVLPCIDNCCIVDLRTVSFDVPPQEVLTKDSVTVSVDAVVYYRISDPLKAVIQVNKKLKTKCFAYRFIETSLILGS